MTAIADGDGDEACSYLTKDARKEFVKRLGQLGPKSCATLSVITENTDQKTLDKLREVDVTDIKISADWKIDQAFD